MSDTSSRVEVITGVARRGALFPYCFERPGNGFVRLERGLGPRTGSRPLAWCSWRRVTAFTGRSRVDQPAIAGRLTMGSSLNGAMVSSVM